MSRQFATTLPVPSVMHSIKSQLRALHTLKSPSVAGQAGASQAATGQAGTGQA